MARLAGVSQSTVSRVFTPGASVSLPVREKVLAAADQLKYRPNALPAILQTGRSGLVAVVMGGFYNPVYAGILHGITTALKERRLEAVLVDAGSDENLGDRVDDLSRYRIDGAISVLAVRSAKVAARLDQLGIPVVAVNSRQFGTLRVVSTSNRTIGRDAADALVDRGCTQLAYLAGRDNPSQRERESGFSKRVVARGLPTPQRAVAGFTYEEGYAAMVQLLASGARPDGLFCVNDLVAIGALDAIWTVPGLRVPEDIQVIGCDDIPMAAWQQNRLTTFVQDMTLLGRQCVEMLGNDPPASRVSVPSTLVVRATTRTLLQTPQQMQSKRRQPGDGSRGRTVTDAADHGSALPG